MTVGNLLGGRRTVMMAAIGGIDGIGRTDLTDGGQLPETIVTPAPWPSS